MKTYEAYYENGKIKFKKKPGIKKGKVLVTFLSEGKKECSTFPVKALGKLKNIERKDLYNEYLSNRY